MHRLIAAFLLVLGSAGTALAQQAVFVVRHAERADAETAGAGMLATDPDLSAAGHARARSLAALLEDARIAVIYTTEFKRSQQTAAPLAKALGITPTVISSKDTPALAERIAAASGNALVVGHSNTVPEIVRALGISETVTVGESEFGNLFVVFRSAPPVLLHLNY